MIVLRFPLRRAGFFFADFGGFRVFAMAPS